MDLRPLRHFVAVAEELHFGRAAERLNMTQPPLSQSIMALERDLGVRLFERTKRTVDLTPVGRQWLPEVRRVLDAAAALPVTAQRLARGESGSFHLAFISPADYSVLPALVSRYKEDYPDVRVTLQEATSDLQIAALLEGAIDAGIIIQQPRAALHNAIAYLGLFHDPIIAAVPAAWVARGRIDATAATLDLRTVADAPLIIFPRRIGPIFHDMVTGCYAAIGVRPTFGQEAVQMQTILSLVAVGMGMALVPSSMRRLGRYGVRYFDLEGEPPRVETALAWRRDDPSPTLARFVDLARAMTGEFAAWAE